MADLNILGLSGEVQVDESLRLDTNLRVASPDVRFDWNFGDGTSSNLARPEKRYSKAGAYTVSLTVTNAAGESRTARSSVVAALFSLVDGMRCDGATPRSGWCHVNYAPTLLSMGFYDDDKAWAWTRSVMRGGDSLMLSADGGRTWASAAPSPFSLGGFIAASPDVGIAFTVRISAHRGRHFSLIVDGISA